MRAGEPDTPRAFSGDRAPCVVRMSANAYCDARSPDLNTKLRQRIVFLAQRHKRYGAGMIYLKLRLAGLSVNYN